MRDGLASAVLFFLFVCMFIMVSDEKPEGRFAETLCANVTCYYELKENK